MVQNYLKLDSKIGRFNVPSKDFGGQTFSEQTEWNGNNHISLVTGTQWDHQILHRTKNGKWILNCWSQWQGSKETFAEINDNDAIEWLIKNEYDNKFTEGKIEVD